MQKKRILKARLQEPARHQTYQILVVYIKSDINFCKIYQAFETIVVHSVLSHTLHQIYVVNNCNCLLFYNLLSSLTQSI